MALDLPIAVMTDSYKATHFAQYPDCLKMVAYGEFRKPYSQLEDNRFVFYGIRYIVENYLNKKWTVEDVEKAALFYKTHGAGKTNLIFPKDLFLKFVNENDGYFPIRLQALPEGTCANIHVPTYQMTAEAPYARLITFFETILTHVWYPSTVATLSRKTKDLIEEAFDKSVDDDSKFLLDSRLHDFGFRGCTCVEQATLGGCGHLLNFTGSDTMSAAYYAQFNLNNGKPIAESIPATEHSVMTAWKTEREAIMNMVENFGSSTGLYACVMDSYDYKRALYEVLPTIVEEKNSKGGFFVIRPDSGDPTESILMALDAGEKAFGATTNSKGYKVLNGVGAIQGDGINIHTVKKILDATLEAGYSAMNVAFGMGSGLLQKINRDTMSFATKLSYIQDLDEVERDIMKYPKTDAKKISLPGILKVHRVDGQPTVFPHDAVLPEGADEENLLKVVYDSGPVENAFPEDFDTLRDRVQAQWNTIKNGYDPVSAPLKEKIENWIESHKDRFVIDNNNN